MKSWKVPIKVMSVFVLPWSRVLAVVCWCVRVCICSDMVLCSVVDTEDKIRSGVDIVVGTPGRIMDFLERRTLDLRQLKHVVLDEVDRMLDMGFADSVDEILQYRYRHSMQIQQCLTSSRGHSVTFDIRPALEKQLLTYLLVSQNQEHSFPSPRSPLSPPIDSI